MRGVLTCDVATNFIAATEVRMLDAKQAVEPLPQEGGYGEHGRNQPRQRVSLPAPHHCATPTKEPRVATVAQPQRTEHVIMAQSSRIVNELSRR
jgi:hypothetical protein